MLMAPISRYILNLGRPSMKKRKKSQSYGLSPYFHHLGKRFNVLLIVQLILFILGREMLKFKIVALQISRFTPVLRVNFKILEKRLV